MKNKFIGFIFKSLAFCLSFAIIFVVVQDIYCTSTETSDKKLTREAKTFYKLEENSLEVVFLGPSQVFCGINAQKLTEEFGISSYDFAGRAQILPTSYYYLQEVLKTQKPTVVCVEVSPFFEPVFNDKIFIWNYLQMPFSKEKYNSLLSVLDKSRAKVFEYCCAPLLIFHSMWNQTNPISKAAELLANDSAELSRGYLKVTDAEEQTIAYLQEDEGIVMPLPESSQNAVLNMKEICESRGTELLFFKTPVSAWTRADSKAVKKFMEENGLKYFDMNDYIDEIGIDPKTDFINELHLNASGADKSTEFIAKYLRENYDV